MVEHHMYEQIWVVFSVMLSIPGNHILALRIFFVSTKPWWPSWVRSMAFCLRDFAMTMRVPHSTIDWSAVIDSSGFMFENDCAISSQFPVWMALMMDWSLLSVSLADLMSWSFIAMGVLIAAVKLTYSLAISSALGESVWEVGCRDA